MIFLPLLQGPLLTCSWVEQSLKHLGRFHFPGAVQNRSADLRHTERRGNAMRPWFRYHSISTLPPTIGSECRSLAQLA